MMGMIMTMTTSCGGPLPVDDYGDVDVAEVYTILT